jgi:hypothetical protein
LEAGLRQKHGKSPRCLRQRAFERFRETAGTCCELLDLLRAHKWIYIKLATNDGLRAAYKLEKRDIDVLRETYGRDSGEVPIEQFSEAGMQRRNS